MLSVHKAQDEINLVQNRIARIDEQAHHLQLERLVLLGRLNDLQASTRSLPSEMLALIFKHSLDSDWDSIKNGTWAFTLSHVSSHWRQVTWLTPQLWDHVGFYIEGEGTTDGIARILDLHLRYSRDLPFSFEFVSKSKAKKLDSLEPVLFDPRYSRKIQTLKVTRVPMSLVHRISREFPRLKHVSIEEPFLDSHLNHYTSLLWQLSVGMPRDPPHRQFQQIVWKSLTKLELIGTPIDVCAKMFTQCSNLIKFRSTCPQFAMVNAPPADFNPCTVFRNLQHLYWSFNERNWSLVAFRHVRLPTLRRLTLQSKMCNLEIQDSIMALFRSPGDALRVLHLESFSHLTYPLVEYIFRQCPSMQELCLTSCDGGSVATILSILSLGTNDGPIMKYLPFLKHLIIKSTRALTDLGNNDEVSTRVLEVCKTRFTGPGSTFTLDFDSLDIDLVPDVAEVLNEMVQDGFQLELVDKHGEVSWE